MPAVPPLRFTATSDGPLPSALSTVACAVCGHHALAGTITDESATGETTRLACTVCGAHQLTDS